MIIMSLLLLQLSKNLALAFQPMTRKTKTSHILYEQFFLKKLQVINVGNSDRFIVLFLPVAIL